MAMSDIITESKHATIIYGSGHEGVTVLLPGFAIKPGNKTSSPAWPDPYLQKKLTW